MRIEKLNVKTLPKRWRRLEFNFKDFNGRPWLTASSNIQRYLGIYGFEYLFEDMGVWEFSGFVPNILSAKKR